MKTGLMLVLLGGAQIYLGLHPDPFYRLFLWSGTSFIVVGLGYSRLGTRVFGKSPDGKIVWWNCLLRYNEERYNCFVAEETQHGNQNI